MDNNRIQSSANAGYDQTRILEQERTRLDQLMGGPGLIDPNQRFGDSADDGLRPEDALEITGPAAAPPPLVAPPQVGPAVAQEAEDVVLPLDGRGAAVALQEYLQKLLQENRQEDFNATAEALGVQNPAAFRQAVESGSALQSFSQVDSNRLVFTDSQFNEVDADNLSAVAKAQLVIKPSYEVPVDPEIETPEVAILDPTIRQQNSLQPLESNPAAQQQAQQAQPEQLLTNDARPVLI
ncbi:MAG: hypothetical protein ACO1RX_12030 [Candidatus Sericytochromatia bacterium]